MNEGITLFTGEGFNVRIQEIDGEPWFMLKDLLQQMETASTTTQAIASVGETLGEGYACNIPLMTPGGKQNAIFVAMPAATYLTGAARTPAGVKFNRWIHLEVIPSIIKTGSYSLDGKANLREHANQCWMERYDITKNVPPPGYFLPFNEMSRFILTLIQNDLPYGPHTVPDISVGQRWSSYWKELDLDEHYGFRQRMADFKYPDSYPQSRATDKLRPWVYPLIALGEFRRWMDTTYIPEMFPRYLEAKIAKGDIKEEVVMRIVESVSDQRIEAQ